MRSTTATGIARAWKTRNFWMAWASVSRSLRGVRAESSSATAIVVHASAAIIGSGSARRKARSGCG